MRPSIGAPWWRGGRKSPHRAVAAGTFSTRAFTASTASTPPTSSFAPMATKHSLDGRTSRKWKPRSRLGTMPRRRVKGRLFGGGWTGAGLDNVVYVPLGMYLRYFAWRKNVSGIAQGPLPFFWGVDKTV